MRFAKHLEVNIKKDQVKLLASHLDFGTFAQNPAVNNSRLDNKETGAKFMRKGQVGDWKNHFDEEASKTFSEWIQKQKSDIGIQCKHLDC